MPLPPYVAFGEEKEKSQFPTEQGCSFMVVEEFLCKQTFSVMVQAGFSHVRAKLALQPKQVLLCLGQLVVQVLYRQFPLPELLEVIVLCDGLKNRLTFKCGTCLAGY